MPRSTGFVDKNAAGCSVCHVGGETKRHIGTMDKARQFTNPSGNSVLAITVPVYNAPDATPRTAMFTMPSHTLLGTLDIGLSQAPLQRTMGKAAEPHDRLYRHAYYPDRRGHLRPALSADSHADSQAGTLYRKAKPVLISITKFLN